MSGEKIWYGFNQIYANADKIIVPRNLHSSHAQGVCHPRRSWADAAGTKLYP